MVDEEESSFSKVSTQSSFLETASRETDDVEREDMEVVLYRVSLCYDVLPLVRDKLMKLEKYTSLDLMNKKKEFKDEEKRLNGLTDAALFCEGVNKQLKIWKDLFKAFINDVNSGKSTPEIADLVQKLDEEKLKTDDLQKKLDIASEETEQLKTKLDDANKELADLRRRLEEAQKKAADLGTQLEEQRAQNEDLQKKLDEEKKENASLVGRLDASSKRVKELEEEKAFHPIFDEPKIRNETLVFKPTTYPDGRVVFLKREGIYKYFFIASSIVERMIRERRLDPTKEARCLVRDFETHCSTDEESERVLAEEYHMPKGEDFYICTGEVSQ